MEVGLEHKLGMEEEVIELGMLVVVEEVDKRTHP